MNVKKLLTSWFSPPTHILTFYISFCIIFLSVLIIVGIRLISHDRIIARDSLRIMVENLVDNISSDISAKMIRTKQQLSGLASNPNWESDLELKQWIINLPVDGALIIIDDHGGSEVIPEGHVLYRPAITIEIDEMTSNLSGGESLDLQVSSLDSAQTLYQSAYRSGNDVRALSELFRLARTLKSAGDLPKALSIYEQIGSSEAIMISGTPSDLMAKVARSELLKDSISDTSIFLYSTIDLYSELNSGKWRLNPAAHQYYSDRISQWLPYEIQNRLKIELDLAEKSINTQTLVWLQESPESPVFNSDRNEGQIVVGENESQRLLLWKDVGNQKIFLVLGLMAIKSLWFDDILLTLVDSGARLNLISSTGELIFGDEPSSSEISALRHLSATGLPWSVQVSTAFEPELNSLISARSQLYFIILTIVGCLVFVSTYFIQRAIGKEQRISRIQSDFISGISHELKSPLTSIIQLSELLTHGRVKDQEQRDVYYRDIFKESTRLKRLVENLLSFGRLEAKSHSFLQESIDIKKLLHSTVDRFKEVYLGDQIITISSPEKCRYLTGDRESLDVVIWNLLENATAYSYPSSQIEVDLTYTNSSITISVKDESGGIRESDQASIFSKFFRGENAKQSSHKGSGIGLSLVQRIMELHQGRIEFESNPGAGSKFSITLPAEREI